MRARNVNSKTYRSTDSRRARTGATSAAPRATRIGKVRKAFWLDPRLVDEVFNVMRELDNEGMTQIVVTHSAQFAKDTKCKVLLFENNTFRWTNAE